MATKKYSAGAIFLQVVPVFGNVQRAIEDEAKNIDRALGDQMEKSGDEAGRRAGRAAGKSMRSELSKESKQISDDMERDFKQSIAGLNKALGDIDTSKMGDQVKREVRAMRRELASISDVDIKVDDNFEQVAMRAAAIRSHLHEMEKGTKLRLEMDGLVKVYRQLGQVDTAIQGIDTHLNLDVDTKVAERKIGAFERSIKASMAKASKAIGDGPNKDLRRLRDELDYLGKLRVGIDIGGAQLRREVGEIMVELEHLARTDPEIDVKFESGKASAELRAWNAATDRADGKVINARAELDTSHARRGMGLLSRDSDGASNAFRSFNVIMLATASIGPALIPVLGAIAGGLLAIGPAAGVAAFGLGAVLIGFSGLGDAIGALQDRDEAMAQTAVDSARTQGNAARAVADARRSAARAIESALDQQAEAQERYRDSIEDVKEAEQALRDARAAAKGTGADIKEQLSDNALAQDQGLLDVFNATVSYNAIMADGSATNAEQEQARINLENARDALADLRAEEKKLRAEQKKWQEEGVNGTEEVENAQDALNDALDAQKDAYEAVGEAAEAVDQARADGARMVADALRNQAQAAEEVSSAQQKVNDAFDKLGPAGREFALFLHGMRDDFYAFRDDIQSVLLPAVAIAIGGFTSSESGATLRDAMIALAADFGELVKALSVSFQGEAWLGFFRVLRDIGPDIQQAYGQAFIAFLEGMASVMTVLAPYALEFAEGFRDLMRSFAEWAGSKEGASGLQEFMGYVKDVAPAVLDLVVAFAGAVTNLLVALAPYGDMMLGLLTGFLDFIAEMDPKTLGAIASSILGIMLASQVAYAVLSTLIAGVTLWGSTIGLIVFAAIGIGLALATLWRENEEFRDFMKKAWEEIGPLVQDAWEDHLKPALEELWEVLKELWKEVLEPMFEWLGPVLLDFAKVYFPALIRGWGIVARGIAWLTREVLIPVFKFLGKNFVWMWENMLKPAFKFLRSTFEMTVRGIKWAWEKILQPAWKAISAAAKWLWKEVLEPTFEALGEGWDDLMSGMKWVWNKVLKPVFNFITQDALPKLKGAFETTVDAISTVWSGLKAVVGKPIKFVIETIINEGLIAGFNKVAKWVGMEGFDPIPIPGWMQNYATGGVLPGYTPGKDVHTFVSPTGGRLNLSGGEAILRPEVTRALGKEWVDSVNGAAMGGGIGGVKRLLRDGRGYFMGGVLPLDMANDIKRHDDGYGYASWAGDLNSPYDLASPPSAVRAWKAGTVTHVFHGYGDAHGRYGNHVAMDHGDQNSLYAHLSSIVSGILGMSVPAGAKLGRFGTTGNSTGAHLHFEVTGGPALSGGAGVIADTPKVPGWIKSLVKDPLGTVKGWVSDQWGKAGDSITSSPVFDYVKRVPLELAGGVKDKVMGIIPGWAKAAGSAIADGAGAVVDGVKGAAGGIADAAGFATGGILPYNGTMMYDNGGYLAPGLTTVMNLTGKPEPVFTDGQWKDLSGGGKGDGGIHYEPHFEGSDLRAEDVASDLNFTFRRLKRQGKYEEVGS